MIRLLRKELVMKFEDFDNMLEEFDVDSIASVSVDQVYEWVKTGKLKKENSKLGTMQVS